MTALKKDHRGTADPALRVTVAIPAHNPEPIRLARVVEGVLSQSLPQEYWEALLIDNASDPRVTSTDPRMRVVVEPQVGLTCARIRAIREARGDILAFVDDDNLLERGYLQAALDYLDAHREVAAIGGVIVPEYETTPPAWIDDFSDLLALRNCGPKALVSDGSVRYPRFAPVGAGMVIRKEAAERWLEDVESRDGAVPDRTGSELSSSGDNDLIFSCLRAGERVAYVPALELTHLIPAARLRPEYLARLNRGIQKSWIQVLHLNGACPWSPVPRWTLPLRKARAYVRHRAWRRPAEWIRWHGACGHFEGRAELG